MAVTITKGFWDSDGSEFDAIAKIVFTSPNIDSPASAGTRSYILPGADYIGTWYESVALMYRVRWRQDAPNKLETYFNKIVMNQDEPFNFNTDSSMSVKTSFPTTFSGGQIVNYSREEYAIIDFAASTGTTAEGGTDLGSDPFNGTPLNGAMCSDGSYIYRLNIDSREIHRYNINDNFWEFLINAPDTFTNYASCTIVGNFLYCVRGSGNTFWKLDLVNSNWYSIAVVPIVVDYYTDIVSFNDTTILFLKVDGTDDKNIYEYTISGDSWSTFFDLSEGNPSNKTWFGPSIYYNESKYYTFGWNCSSSSVAELKYYEIDVGALDIDNGSLWYSTTLSGSSNITGAACFGSQITSGTDTDVFSHCFAETDNTPKYLSTFRFATVNSGTVCADGSGNFSSGCTGCWEDNSGAGQDYEYAATSLTFVEDVVPASGTSSVSSDGNYFYFFEKENLSENGFLYSYNLVSSGTLASGIITCDETSSYLAGEGVFAEDWTNLYQTNGKLYTNEGPYTNNFWVCDVVSGTWSNFLGPASFSGTGTDRKFTSGEHSRVCDDGTDLYVLRGKDYKNFYKYTISSGTWGKLADTPAPMFEYCSAVYVSASNSIFVSQGKLSVSFWEYDISGDNWTVRQGTPGSFQDKGCIYYPRWGGNYIYAVKGQDYNDFWRYSRSANTWSSMRNLITYDNLALGVISKGSDYIYVLNGNILYQYTESTNTWSSVTGEIYYLDTYKRMASDDSANNIFIFGSAGMRKYEFTDIGIANPYPYTYNLDFDSVVGTSIVPITDYFSSWQKGLLNSYVWANSKNSVVFTVTNGECYDVRLTAWDDDTHTTTSNKILDEEHYKVTACAFRAEGGTKQEPTCGDNVVDCLVFGVAVDQVLKGNVADKYYGDFDLIHIANGGLSGNAHGEYLIFSPRLDDMDETFTSGNYDFVTTLHYQYT